MKSILLTKAITYAGLASLTLFAFSVCSTAYGNDTPAPQAAAMDQLAPGEGPTSSQFLNKALGSGKHEVEVSQLAAQKASAEGVRDFAAMLVKDHSRLNERLENAADTKNIPLDPVQPPADTISGLTGAKFDAAYLDFMIDGHKKSIALYTAGKNSDDASVRELSNEMLPKLEHHLHMAQELKAENDKIMASMDDQ